MEAAEPTPPAAAEAKKVEEKQPVVGAEEDAEASQKQDEHKNTEEALLARILELQRQRDEGVWDKASENMPINICMGWAACLAS